MNINDAVLAQIKIDVESGDLTAIEEMIKELPEDALVAYLPETLWPFPAKLPAPGTPPLRPWESEVNEPSPF